MYQLSEQHEAETMDSTKPNKDDFNGIAPFVLIPYDEAVSHTHIHTHIK